MNLRDLKYIVEVAREKNFARAYNHATSYAHAHRVDQGILHTVCPQVSPDVQFMSIDKVFRTTCEPGI